MRTIGRAPAGDGAGEGRREPPRHRELAPLRHRPAAAFLVRAQSDEGWARRFEERLRWRPRWLPRSRCSRCCSWPCWFAPCLWMNGPRSRWRPRRRTTPRTPEEPEEASGPGGRRPRPRPGRGAVGRASSPPRQARGRRAPVGGAASLRGLREARHVSRVLVPSTGTTCPSPWTDSGCCRPRGAPSGAELTRPAGPAAEPPAKALVLGATGSSPNPFERRWTEGCLAQSSPRAVPKTTVVAGLAGDLAVEPPGRRRRPGPALVACRACRQSGCGHRPKSPSSRWTACRGRSARSAHGPGTKRLPATARATVGARADLLDERGHEANRSVRVSTVARKGRRGCGRGQARARAPGGRLMPWFLGDPFGASQGSLG